MLKRSIVWILSLVLALGCLSIPALAEDGGMVGEAGAEPEGEALAGYLLGTPEEEAPALFAARSVSSGTFSDSLTWSLDTSTRVLTISGTGAMADFASASSAPWYSSRYYINSIVVESGVTSIGKYAFRYCYNLTTVSLPDTITSIGAYSFQQCTALTTINFPEGLTTIGTAAFNVCSVLDSIHLPASLTELGDSAFYGCEVLSNFTLAEGNESFVIQDRTLYSADMTKMRLCPADLEELVVPETVSRLTVEALAHCTKLKEVTLHDSLTWATDTFAFCSGLENFHVNDTNPNYATVDGVLFSKDLTKLVRFPSGRTGHYSIPDGTKIIGTYAFMRMKSPITISMTDSMEQIDYYAFAYSPGLTTINLPASLTSIGSSIFDDCTGLCEVNLSKNLTVLGYSMFSGCSSLTKVAIPEQITQIDGYFCEGCTSLTTVTMPDGVTSIGYMAFSGCTALEELELPSKLTTIGSYAFEDSGLREVVIPSGVVSIPTGAFDYCDSLTKAVLPFKLETIGNYAFRGTAITELVVPETVTSIGSGALNPTSLAHIHFQGDAPAVSSNSFASGVTLYYLEGKTGWTSPTWNGFNTQTWSCDFSTTADCVNGGAETIACNDCGMETTREAAPYGHTYGEWVLISTPTESEDGLWERYCSVCGNVEPMAIPAFLPAEQIPVVSNNLADQNYSVYGKRIYSYLIDNGDGTVTRLEAGETEVTLETYDEDFEMISRKALPTELTMFGGFYEGEDYYFLVFGQVNKEEDDSVEVVRVVRYTKDWLRKGHASLYGANTYIPFDAGSLRMTQYGDMLYVHTCHEMYASSDGLHHQANMIFSVYIPDMEITDQYTGVMNVGYGYVSHSFNQFILTYGDKLLTLNHGDAHPRSAVIVQYGKPAGEMKFTGSCTNTNVMSFASASNYNATGASLGAFALSDSAILTAGNSILQDGTVTVSGQRNIFIGVTSLGEISSAETSIKWITNYADGTGIAVSTPHMVKIDGNRFLLMWTEDGELRYVFVDGSGNMTSSIMEASFSLSDCVPVVVGSKVCWYVTNNSKPVFFTISLDAPEETGIYAQQTTVTLEPGSGTLDSNTLTVRYGQPYGTLPVPTGKSAQSFLGWYTSKQSSSQESDPEKLVTADRIVTSFADHTLYAHWQTLEHTCQYEDAETIPATCTSGKKVIRVCKYCDESYTLVYSGYAHTWDDGTITTAPTCTGKGSKTLTCTLCGATTTETVAATGHSYTETVTSPGCLSRGYTTYTCHCGYSYTDEYVSALGHDYKAVVTAPTCTAQGYTTHTCSRCSDSYIDTYVDAAGHAWDEGVVTKEPTVAQTGVMTYTCGNCGETKTEDIEKLPAPVLFDIYGSNMTLGNDLSMSFFIEKADLTGTDYYAVITRSYSDDRADVTETVKFADWKSYDSTLYYVTFEGIAAKEMCDEISVTIYNGDGTAASSLWTDSVKAYAERIFEQQSDSVKTLLADMLNYGAAAQQMLDYNTANLANSGLTSAQAAYATDSVTFVDNRVKGKNYYGSTLSLENRIELYLFFTNVSADMNAVVTYTDFRGNTVTRNISGADFDVRGTLTGVAVDDLVVADGFCLVTCEIYDGGTLVASASDSMESYCARQAASGSIYEAVMKFVSSAQSYLLGK